MMRFLCNFENMRAKAAPLTDGQPEEEYAYVEIDSERHVVDAYVSGYPETCDSMSGTVGYYPVSPLVDGQALTNFLESDEFRELAERIVAGTRLETIDGCLVGLADGDARAAETDLTSRLGQLPDHEIQFCSSRSWVSSQGDLLALWPDVSLEEAVRRLAPAFNRTLSEQGIRVLGRWSGFAETGDIGDELVDEARRRFGIGDQLYRCHIEVLANCGYISNDQMREWEEKNADLPDK